MRAMAETSVGKILRLSGRSDPQFIELYNQNHDDKGEFSSGGGGGNTFNGKPYPAVQPYPSSAASLKGKPFDGGGVGSSHPSYVKSDGTAVHMYRGPGQKTRFYDNNGNQHGPEQANVAPAAAYAESQGWKSPGMPPRH